MTMKASEFASCLGDTLKGTLKILMQSRSVKAPAPSAKGGDRVIILGNGPSLKETIDTYSSLLAMTPTVAVNFMANTPQFAMLKPDFYVLADPHFFNRTDQENVRTLWAAIAASTHNMTLCVPADMAARAEQLLGEAPRVSIATFNFVGVEGFTLFEDMAFNSGMAMPRPRNVLIPAIMAAIAAGYRDIYLTGADHSWLETIRVTDDNHVVSVQPHFYADSKTELNRSATEYKGYHLHDILKSFYTAFRSYHVLARYAATRGVRIYNATPGSYIDAFERKSLC